MYPDNMVALGKLNNDNIHFDVNGKQFYKSFSNKEQPISESKLLGLVLLALPLVRFLNSFYAENATIFNIILLVISILFMVVSGKRYARKQYTDLILTRFEFSKGELEEFLLEECKHVRVIMVTVFLSFIGIAILSLIFIFSSTFICFFISVGLVFPLVLILYTKPFLRRKVINSLLIQYQDNFD